MRNLLATETSPYLLQHADNPVHWMPWGEEAFARARAENKPVFLSVGYSTCHWCHVMAHESFENPVTAAILNENFVSIKLDREERPDVDRLYMAYVQTVTGSGGWPMSVWLTPDGEPFFGGTYFPPEDRHGRPGFPQLLRGIAAAWVERPDELRGKGREALAMLRESAAETTPGDEAGRWVERAAQDFANAYDAGHGGFGRAPKFPRPSVFSLLLRAASPGDGRAEMVFETLRKMSSGGMHDHLGGGFHRYSVDRFWHVPHFEKMLYDQAQIAVACLEAWQLSGDPAFRGVVTSTLDYVLRDLGHEGGGFYAAEDADSLLDADSHEHAEGAFYVWTHGEIMELLGEEAGRVFCHHYSVRPEGNAPESSDPQGEFVGKNILHARGSVMSSAKDLGMEVAELENVLSHSRALLFQNRARRPRPHRDEKIVTAWNGLAISALALAGAALGEKRYLDAARDAAGFVLAHLRKDNGLLRSWCGQAGRASGVAEDYAFFAAGLLDLYTATGEWHWASLGIEIQDELDSRFRGGTGYFTSEEGDPLVLVRMPGDHDGAEPLADSVGARNLIRIAAITGEEAARTRAREIVLGRSGDISRYPTAFPALLATAWELEAPPRQAVIAGPPDSSKSEEFRRALLGVFRPGLVVISADGEAAGLSAINRELAKMTPGNRGPRVYLCESFVCRQPCDDLRQLKNVLNGSG
ncbi:MAG: thioredoxin domain-containing protein [Terrimicrobiaceae bacterium]